MAKWELAVLVAGAGVLAAVVVALGLSPVAAFAIGAGVALAVVAAVRSAAPPSVQPVPAPAAAMSSGFGRALIEKLPTPLLLVTPTGRVSYANPAAREALPRLQAGVHFSHLIRAPAFVEAVGATLADGAERTVRFAAAQGRERFFEARVGFLPPGEAFGPEALAIVQIEDRTETRRAEQLRSDFVANASHELRTPLASIIGYIETLQHHARDDAEARERFLGIMAREAGRMQRLVDDLMSLGRIEMSEHLRPVELWSLNRIAAESAAALLPVAEQQGVALEIDLPAEGAMVIGDRDQLAQVFTNLIDNATKYGGPGSDGAGAGGGAEPGLSGAARGDGGGHRAGDRAGASAAADRALLPGERRLEPQQGRHRARAGHRQAHPEPARGAARGRVDAGEGKCLHGLAAAFGGAGAGREFAFRVRGFGLRRTVMKV